MMSNKALELLNNQYKEPCFTLFHPLGRGLFSQNLNLNGPHITKAKSLDMWLIIGEHLKQRKSSNVLYDGENYLIYWQFEYVLNKFNEKLQEVIFFHWKGNNAEKGYSPLPSEIEVADPVVERLYQWSEPPVFFHIFKRNLIVMSGKEEEFNPLTTRLFIIRGELRNEIHLFEVPYESGSLRSRTIYFLVDPKNNKIYSWCGSAVTSEYKNLIFNEMKLIETLKSSQEEWNDFDAVDLIEGKDNITLFETTEQEAYYSIRRVLSFTPRLFYIYFIDQELSATEVEYGLKSSKCASFPFLQTHLYTATQPGKYLVCLFRRSYNSK